jgi:membrane-associated phospholipid phosphatase
MNGNLNTARTLVPRYLVATSVLIASFALDGPARESRAIVLALAPERLLLSVSELGNPAALATAIVILFACGLFTHRSRLTRAACVLTTALVGTGIIVLSLKWLAGRSYDGVFHGFGAGDGRISFPSGHTAMAFAACAVIGTVWRKARWPAFAVAAGVAVSRATLVHLLSDVVAGAVIGTLVGQLVTGWAAEVGFLTLDVDARGKRSPAPGRPAPDG